MASCLDLVGWVHAEIHVKGEERKRKHHNFIVYLPVDSIQCVRLGPLLFERKSLHERSYRAGQRTWQTHCLCFTVGFLPGFLSLKCSCAYAVKGLGSLQDSCISTLTTAQKSLRQGSLRPCRVLKKRPQCLRWTLRFCWWKGFPLLCALRPEGASGSIGMNHTNVATKFQGLCIMSCPWSLIGFP